MSAPHERPRRSLAQTVFRDGAVYAVAGVVTQGIAFLLFPFFAHVFDPSDYGIIDLIAVVMTVINLTVALEVAQGLGRCFADARSPADRRAYASTALLFSLGCYSAFAVVVLAAAEPLSRAILGADVDADILRLAVAMFWTSGIAYLATDLLRWQLRPMAFAITATTTALTITTSSALYVLVLDWGVEGALIGQATGFAAGAVVALALGRRCFGLHFDRRKLREMLAYSLPLVPASTGVFLNGYADRVAIQAQATLADVGLYGVAYRLSVIVSLTLLGFQGALLPQVLRHHDAPGTPAELARVFRLFCALALSVLVLTSTWADELLQILTRPVYYAAGDIVPLVVAAAFFAGMYIFAPGLNIARRTRTIALVTVAGGVSNLALALVLVGPLGITGAAIAFLVTAAGTFAALMSVSQRLYPAPHPWPRLLRAAGLGAVLTAAGWGLPAAEEHLWALPAKLVFCVAGVTVLGLLLVDADERAMGRHGARGVLARLRPGAPTQA